MMEPIMVEAQFEQDGTLRPVAFQWQGEMLRVNSLGRRWDSEDYRHFLVEVNGLGVFELVHHLTEYSWKLSRKPSDFGGSTRGV